MNPLKERLQTFLNHEGIVSLRAFERQCDIKAGTASKMTEKSYGATFHKIAQTYPMLNIDWLKTGRGEMLKSKGDKTITQIGNSNKGGSDNTDSFNDGISADELKEILQAVKESKSDIKTDMECVEDDVRSMKEELAQLRKDFMSQLAAKDAQIEALTAIIAKLTGK